MPLVGVLSIAIITCVCLSVSLFVSVSVRVSQKPHVQISRNFPCMRIVVAARSSLTTLQYIMYMIVMCHSSVGSVSNTTLCLVEFVMWRHRGRSLMSTIVLLFIWKILVNTVFGCICKLGEGCHTPTRAWPGSSSPFLWPLSP